jgi:hypothetical protein
MRLFRRGDDRFEKFTERARKVLAYAQEEAQRFNHNYIGTEHILLGLVREGNGVAAKVLLRLGVNLADVRREVEMIIGRGDRIVLGEIGFTPRSKKVVELAVDEARRLNHHYIGTEHLLLGLIREGEGIAAGVLHSLGVVDLEMVRREVIRTLGETQGRRMTRPVEEAEGETTGAGNGGPRSNVITCRIDDRDLDALDALVEAGIRSTRSDAASWLIHTGIDAQRTLFERVYETVAQIRQLRAAAQAMAQNIAHTPDVTITTNRDAPAAEAQQPSESPETDETHHEEPPEQGQPGQPEGE